MSSLTPSGYVTVGAPGHPLADKKGRVYEHRLVAYEAGLLPAGRPDLHVHHINENKSDNRLENLEVTPAAVHLRQHRLRYDQDEAIRLYVEEGLKMVEIGLRLGVHHTAISRLLAERGIKALHRKDYSKVTGRAA